MSADIKTMDDLFVHTLRDIYYAEQQIMKALPKMIGKATDADLKEGFQTHLKETEGQIARLEKVFEMHGVEAKGSSARQLTASLKKPGKRRAMLPTKRCSTLLSWQPPKRSNTAPRF